VPGAVGTIRLHSDQIVSELLIEVIRRDSARRTDYNSPASDGHLEQGPSSVLPHRAGLAQLVVHLICNQGVGGSSPSAGTK
jgi:hypothetical protein